MISFEGARKKIREVRLKRRMALIPIEEALGHVLARSLRSPESLPSFSNSAMDGWAVRSEDLEKASPTHPVRLRIQGKVPAGSLQIAPLQGRASMRIFTGAPLPKGANAVVMQERVSIEGREAIFFEPVRRGENVRFKAEDLLRGTRILKKGTPLHAGSLALCAQVGITRLPVYLPPRVALIATGSELVPPYEKPKTGQIRDSVSLLLRLLLRKQGLDSQFLGVVPDLRTPLRQAIRRGLRFEVLLLTGGVSVGEHDLVKEILKGEGVREIFWKVDMKPGKPIFFGERGKTFVFGLPGNPLSAFVGFEFFVRPLLERLQGIPGPPRPFHRARLASDISLKGMRKTHLLTARFSKNGECEAQPLRPQGSHRIAQLAQAQGWVILTQEKKIWKKGEEVPCQPWREGR